MNILDILQRYTDEDHRLSQKDIIDILANEYDMKADRKSIRRNIMNLMDCGYEIEYSESIRMVPVRDKKGQQVYDPKTGEKRNAPKDGKDCEFAIVCRMATPGRQIYSRPYYFSAFRDSWFDIYELIGIGKRFMIQNTSAPRLQIEVHDDYWDVVCDNDGITDEDERKARIKEEKQRIIDFVCGPKNAGKALISGYYVDPSGKEHSMVRVINLNQGKKEGGDWADDMQEAANTLCFAFGVHPNLIGATPGKSQMNNSGSDKRELFTMKQALEKPFHDVMMKPYHVILHYNGWSKNVTVDVPMLMLTTLDENKDAEKVTTDDDATRKLENMRSILNNGYTSDEMIDLIKKLIYGDN